MEVSRIITEIDAQIAKLQQARALLLGTTGRAPGRPKGSKSSTAPRKRRLSAAGRKRISEAMKKRWEEQRKKNPKKS